MSFPRYPQYKNSGVEWVGQIPAHWSVVPLKYVVELRSGGTPSKERLDYWDGNVPWASSKDLKVEALHDTVDHVTELAVNDRAAALVASGASVVVVRGMILAHSFPVARLMRPMAINQDLKAVIPREAVDGRFLSWMLRGSARESLTRLDEAGHGTKALRMDAWTSMELPIPPVDEQESLADFLDHEAAKIDALVVEQERLIALLKEKRQAVISHAVTKGLNPNAPMKDSGVDWLGSVPAAWTMTPLRYLVHSVGQGWSPQCESYAADLNSEYGVLKVGAVNAGVFDPSENKKLPPELEPPADLAIRAGDLMISRANTRELVGSAAVADADYPRLLLCDKLYRLRFRRSSKLPKFIARYLATSAIREQIELGASGASASMLNISQSVILDLPVPVPPEDEMMTVLEFCAQAARQTSELIAQAKGAVDLLLERRAALITAAVTGQIDVRGLVLTEAA